MALALQTAAELTLQEKLNEKLITVFRVPGYEADLVRGHEAALRIIDAGSYMCLCCPPALCCGRGKRMRSLARWRGNAGLCFCRRSGRAQPRRSSSTAGDTTPASSRHQLRRPGS